MIVPVGVKFGLRRAKFGLKGLGGGFLGGEGGVEVMSMMNAA